MAEAFEFTYKQVEQRKEQREVGDIMGNIKSSMNTF